MVAAVCINAFGSHIANAQTPDMTPSEVWIGAGSTAQTAYVRGSVEGAAAAKAMVRQLVERAGADDRVFKTSDMANRFDSTVVLYLGPLTDPPGNMRSIVDVINKIYSDPANSCVPWVGALNVATKILGGRSAADTENFLSKAREFGAKKCEL